MKIAKMQRLGVRGSELGVKIGDEIAAAKDKSLSSAIGVFSGVNAVNDNDSGLQIKTNAVFPYSEPMGSGGQVHQRLGERKGVSAFDHCLGQDNPNSCLIFSKGTNPSFLASSMPFLSLSANLGLIGRRASIASMSQPTGLWNIYSSDGTFSSNFSSITHKRSHNEYVSKTKYLGDPPLSTITPALKSFIFRPNFFSSAGIASNFSNASNLTASLFDSLTNDFDFISLPPRHLQYNTPILSLSRLFSFIEVEADSNVLVSRYVEGYASEAAGAQFIAPETVLCGADSCIVAMVSPEGKVNQYIDVE